MAYLRKVKKGWQININHIDPSTGKRKRKTKIVKGTKKEAQSIMADMIKKMETGSLCNPQEITLEEHLNNWLKDKKINVSYRTYKAYYDIAKTHIIPALGKIKLKDIKPYHIKNYLAKKRDHGRIDGSGGLGERTLNYHYTTLNNALLQAVKFELIPKNPCDVIKAPVVRRKKKMNILTFKEVKELLIALKDSWLYPIVFLEINTGMRRGEISALQWEDINFSNQIIHIQRSVYREKNKGLKYKSPKRKSSIRAIDIGNDVITILKEHRKQQLEITKFMQDYNPYNLVFPLENGAQLDPDLLSKKYRQAIKKNNFKEHTFHDLRHTHASLLLSENIPIKIIQERLGHASIKITMDTYAHLIPGMQKEAANRLEEKLKMTSL